MPSLLFRRGPPRAGSPSRFAQDLRHSLALPQIQHTTKGPGLYTPALCLLQDSTFYFFAFVVSAGATPACIGQPAALDSCA